MRLVYCNGMREEIHKKSFSYMARFIELCMPMVMLVEKLWGGQSYPWEDNIRCRKIGDVVTTRL